MRRALQVIRILNKDGNVSIASLAMYTVVVLGIFNWIYFVVGTPVVLLYGITRWINFKRGQVVDAAMRKLLENQASLQTQLNEQKDKITSLSIKAGLLNSNVAIPTNIRRF